ncbi:hypothetical protein [Paenibacillus cymbidii]|uniref:hypothetical protein n=1 Tax=Paenibacillus cymbidii TaxID=1639034 RepID=UPI001081B074|nr:hypothetical protein [Paenibacillus cymbidii]
MHSSNGKRDHWRTVPPIAWENARDNEPSRAIARVLGKWVAFIDRHFRVWDGRPNAGYFLDGAYWYGMETSLPMYTYTALAAFGDYDESVSGIKRDVLRERAIMALRYLCFTHDTGPDDCVRPIGKNKFNSGNKWGGRNDRYFQATQTGNTVSMIAFTAWAFWNELDEETRTMAAAVLVSYADRWSKVEPRDGSFFDTQSEENAWTATGILGAATLFPQHPERAVWLEAYLKWNFNSATVPKDRFNRDEYRGAPLRDKWIRTSTLFPDYTTENHGMVHPNYVASAISFRSIATVLGFLKGDGIPEAAVLWNNVNVYEHTIKRWTQFDGLPIPVQSQDWWYNRQHDAMLVHTCMNVVHGDADAALLERKTMETIAALQDSHSTGCLLEEDGEQYPISPKDFQTARDFESLSAYTLALSYMLHLFGGPGVAPSDEREMSERLAQTYHYPYGATVIGRTPASFSSFSWRNRVMATTLPAKGLWTITPIENSYIGKVVFADDAPGEPITPAVGGIVTETERHHIEPWEHGFGAVFSVLHGNGRIRQRAAFVALPDGSSVYAEQFAILAPCRVAAMHTGLIGVRNERYAGMPHLAPGRRTVYVGGAFERFRGFFGREDDAYRLFPPAPFVNVDDEIGYVLFGTNGVRYLNRHQYPKWKAVEDCLVLNDRAGGVFAGGETLPPFVAVTLPNRTAAETKEVLARYTLLESAASGTMALEAAGRLVFVNLLPERTLVAGSRKLGAAPVRIYDGVTRIGGGAYGWSQETPALRAGMLEGDCTLASDRLGSAELDILRSAGRIAIVNRSGGTPFAGVLELPGRRIALHVPPGGGVTTSIAE